MLDIRTKIGAGGRIVIPAIVREKLHFSVGDEVILSIKDDELLITTTEHALRKLREKVKGHNPSNKSLVDDLLKMRKAETSHD